MIDKINDVRSALKSGNLLSALALALTFPDICGQIEYPNFIDKKRNRQVRKQYEEWFKNYVEPLYAVPATVDNKTVNYPHFKADMCYKLRCLYLHQGNAYIEDFGSEKDEENEYRYSFNLCTDGSDSFGIVTSYPQSKNEKAIKLITVTLNIANLCECLCCAAQDYYNEKGEFAFEDHNIKYKFVSMY